MNLTLVFSALLLESLSFSWISFGVYKKYWNPILMFFLMIFLASLLTFTNDEMNPSNCADGLFWIGTGALMFIGAFAISQILVSKLKLKREKKIYKKSFLSKLMSLCVILSLIAFFIKYKIVMEIAGDLETLFINSTRVRNEYLERESGGIVALMTVFVSINFYCLYCLFPEATKLHCKFIIPKLVIVLIVRLMSSIITMSKDMFVMDLVILISAYCCSFKNWKEETRFAKKYSLVFVFLFIALITAISIQRNPLESSEESVSENVVGTIREYVGIPVEAFCNLITAPSRDLEGQQCFRPVINMLSHFGITERVTIFQDSVAGGDTNVFSIFGNFYNDFSFAGIIFLSIFFGLFLGLFYFPYSTNWMSRIVTNSIIMMTMVFGYFDFKMIQTIYLFIIFYAFFFELTLKNKLYVNENNKN